jgi:Rod binding domain-containing protein
MPINNSMDISRLTNPAQNLINQHQDAKQTALSQLQAIAEIDVNKLSAKEKADLEAKCQEFESLFVKMMLDEMRKSIKHAPSGSGAMDQGRDIYNDMLYTEYAKKMSQSGQFGLGKVIYRQMTTPVIPANVIARRYQTS